MMFAPGMMFTIEPMINEGTEEVFVDGDDDWSVYTKDGKASAQWEIQVTRARRQTAAHNPRPPKP